MVYRGGVVRLRPLPKAVWHRPGAPLRHRRRQFVHRPGNVPRVVQPKLFTQERETLLQRTLRAVVHPTRCAARQQYKKTMIRKLFAQRGGAGKRALRKKLTRTPPGGLKC